MNEAYKSLLIKSEDGVKLHLHEYLKEQTGSVFSMHDSLISVAEISESLSLGASLCGANDKGCRTEKIGEPMQKLGRELVARNQTERRALPDILKMLKCYKV